jgi:hypothetical protein
LLAGCANAEGVHRAVVAPSPVAVAMPHALTSAEAQQVLLRSAPAGDELTIGGQGNRTLRVHLRAGSSVLFACVGSGEGVRFAYGGEWFRGKCKADGTTFAANVGARRYPSLLTLTISVPDRTRWRVSVDGHPIQGL